MKTTLQVLRCFVLILVSLFCMWGFYQYTKHVEVARFLKLSDCTTNAETDFYWRTPKGTHLSLLASSLSPIQPIPSGHIDIFDGSLLIKQVPFKGGGHAITWLNGQYGVILADFAASTNSTFQIVKSNTEYKVEIIFEHPPPPSTSIWLHWLQAGKDRNE